MLNDDGVVREPRDQSALYGAFQGTDVPTLAHVLQPALRFGGAIVGFATLITGLVYLVSLLGTVIGVLKDPSGIEGAIQKWYETIGAENFRYFIDDNEVDVGRLVTVGVLGIGVLVLFSVCLTIMKTGAKIIEWTMGDKEAIKRILRDVLPSRGGGMG